MGQAKFDTMEIIKRNEFGKDDNVVFRIRRSDVSENMQRSIGVYQ